jgi:hypothetical protein
MVVVGLAMLLIIPTFYLFYVHSQEATNQINSARLNRIGNEVLKQARTIYYTGESAKTTLNIDMPEGLERMYINSTAAISQLVMIVQLGSQNHSLVYFSDVPLFFGNCTDIYALNETFYVEGSKKLVIESCGTNVSLRRT